MKKAVFLDRDGTINVEKDYLYRIEDFELVPGAAEAIRLFVESGYLVIVVSNQSGVGRGYYTEEDVHRLHLHAAREIESMGGRVDAWYYCPHHPDARGSYALECKCRKPLPGMINDAAGRYGIDLAQSIMIGDKCVDVLAGRGAGCSVSALVRTGYGAKEEERIPEGVPVYDDLLAAARDICSSTE